MLIAAGLTVALGRKRVLDGVDFEAAPGQVTCIVGPNGSGKTTLLRALTAEVPSTGWIGLDGDDLRRIPPALLAERRAVLPQASGLAFPFTVLEVVRLGLMGRNALAPDAARLPERALATVGLAGYGPRMVQELSGGEQARVHLARVLLQVWQPVQGGRPCWLFLDEPVAALDIRHQLQIMALARDFARRGGGVVAVMHDLNLTAMTADRVVLLREGRVLAAGPVEQVLCDGLLSRAYDCALRVNTPPPGGGAFVLPQAVA